MSHRTFGKWPGVLDARLRDARGGALVRPVGEPGMGPRMKASSRNEAAVGTWGTFPRAAVGMIDPVSVLNDDSACER